MRIHRRDDDPWRPRVGKYERAFEQRVVVMPIGDDTTGVYEGVRLAINGPTFYPGSAIELTPEEATDLATDIAEVAVMVETARATGTSDVRVQTRLVRDDEDPSF